MMHKCNNLQNINNLTCKTLILTLGLYKRDMQESNVLTFHEEEMCFDGKQTATLNFLALHFFFLMEKNPEW